MDSFNNIQILPSPQSSESNLLVLRPGCLLEELYRFPETPSVIRYALEKMVNWHTRNENTVAQALKSRHRFPQLHAVFLGLGYQASDNEIAIPLPDALLHCSVSDVRATPADEPIVSAAVGINIDDRQTIKNIRIIFCGAHVQSPYSLQCANGLVGQIVSAPLIESVINGMQNELQPKSDFQGSVAYRMAMAAVTLKRAWMQCVEEIHHD